MTKNVKPQFYGDGPNMIILIIGNFSLFNSQYFNYNLTHRFNLIGRLKRAVAFNEEKDKKSVINYSDKTLTESHEKVLKLG